MCVTIQLLREEGGLREAGKKSEPVKAINSMSDNILYLFMILGFIFC